MCILLFTTAHPKYPFILLSNRDEFIHRKTAPAAYWEPEYPHIFSGRDMARSEHGTWLGITKTGRLAALTNFRESSSAAAIGEKSRGAMITSFLTASPSESARKFEAGLDDTLSTQSWIHTMLQTGEMKGVGGFSMLCGTLRPNGSGGLEPLAVISNRNEKRDEGVIEGTRWVCGKPGETRGLSNSLFDQPWVKVRMGERLLEEVVAGDVAADKDEDEDEDKEEDLEKLLEKCFQVLSTDTYPPITDSSTYNSELDNLRESIFIPVFDVMKEGAPTPSPPERCCGIDSDNTRKHQMTEEELEKWRQSPRLYGTVQQTVVLLDRTGVVTYVERTLYDSEAKPMGKGKGEVRTRFRIPGWA
ncbi:NRDE protein-domain-containing protein [Pyronema omphalodes]|nr:NRDE protein-domain-containing protein [Pyronema omphalodes]